MSDKNFICRGTDSSWRSPKPSSDSRSYHFRTFGVRGREVRQVWEDRWFDDALPLRTQARFDDNWIFVRIIITSLWLLIFFCLVQLGEQWPRHCLQTLKLNYTELMMIHPNNYCHIFLVIFQNKTNFALVSYTNNLRFKIIFASCKYMRGDLENYLYNLVLGAEYDMTTKCSTANHHIGYLTAYQHSTATSSRCGVCISRS